jgi:hypothetical protein
VARKNDVSIGIYKRHIRLLHYLNDTWIFTILTLPELIRKKQALSTSGSKTKKPYAVPSKGKPIVSHRRDDDIAQVYQAQIDRGIFETNIVSIVSRTEAYIQECLSIAIKKYPKKLSLIAEKSGVPIEMLLANESRDDIIHQYIALRCESMMFGTPKEYLQKVEKVLAITIDQDVLDKYIEIKASRDIIVHNSGTINKMYVEKAGPARRGEIGDELEIDSSYYRQVLVTVKSLSGIIQRETEKTYK